ncbi:hypothetical protein [Mycoplasma marinum]|uniref:Uncharacterized protein n=1 Tax=Mycoplasma marinum TaxID=1937190 RepID=A0A4R0XQ58_9MOLU|nr:hypothetical protein [Mycoplasma marinum]TCG10460.1 hypothetical protein C4B24_04595 [Mycoplasma marinum]
MRIKVLISLEGDESNTEKNFYEGAKYQFPELNLSTVYVIKQNTPINKIEIKINQIIELAKGNFVTEYRITEEILANVYFIWDALPPKREASENKIKSIFNFALNDVTLESGDKIIENPLIIEGGFEMGLIAHLIEPKPENIVKLVEVFNFKNKNSFKKKYIKIFDKILKVTKCKSQEDFFVKLKKEGCSHFVLFEVLN